MTEWPTGLVNFLLTDIERSTRLWEQHPRQMEVALARHEEPNPGTARELEDLLPEMQETLGEGSFARIGDRAVRLDQEAVTDLAVDALRAAGQE